MVTLFMYFCSTRERFLYGTFPCINSVKKAMSKEQKQASEELLENISGLFLKYGLRSTSMEDICSHLKISKKTLYQFFQNKEDVVEQVLMYRRNNKRAQENYRVLMEEKSAIEFFLAIRDSLLRNVNSLAFINQFDVKKYHPAVYQRMRERDAKTVTEMLNQLIDKGIADGTFRQDINREVQIYLFYKQLEVLHDPEAFDALPYPMDIVLATIIKNTIRHFATPKGLEVLNRLLQEENNHH